MREIPIDVAVDPELDRDVRFGPEVEEDGFSAQIADASLGVSVRRLFEVSGQPLPAHLALYDRFETWLVPHRLSVVRRSGLREPVAVGIETEYLNEDRTCSVVGLFPHPSYVVLGGVNLAIRAAASVDANGAVDPATTEGAAGASALPPDLSAALGSLRVGAAAGARGEIGLHITATIATPIISATGIGSRRSEWEFKRDREPLFGRDLEAWAVVVLPKRQRALSSRSRYYIQTRLAFFPRRRQSAWTELSCQLLG